MYFSGVSFPLTQSKIYFRAFLKEKRLLAANYFGKENFITDLQLS